MPRANAKANNQEQESKQEKSFTKVTEFSVDRAREVEYEGKKSCLADVTINGVQIFGCKAVTYEKDGKTTDFVAFPQRKGKGKDGKDAWYHVAYVRLSNEDSAKIAQAIYDKIDGK